MGEGNQAASDVNTGELGQKGFEQKLMELYEEFQRGECSIGYLAEQLGITSWEAVHLLEERGLRTSNL